MEKLTSKQKKDGTRFHAIGPKNNREEFANSNSTYYLILSFVGYDDESSAADRRRRNEARILRNMERDKRRNELVSRMNSL